MTVTLTLQRVNPNASVTSITTIVSNTSVLFPMTFTLTDYPPSLGETTYRIVATSTDGDSINFTNVNMSGLWVRR
jgi:hypothetical protein